MLRSDFALSALASTPQLDKNAGPQLFGMLLFATLLVAFSNLSEVPYSVEHKCVPVVDQTCLPRAIDWPFQ